MPDLRSNWLPFYRPYSFASQPFDCFAENIQFSRSCIAVQPPFVRLPDYFFILSCSSSFVKILRPVFSVLKNSIVKCNNFLLTFLYILSHHNKAVNIHSFVGSLL